MGRTSLTGKYDFNLDFARPQTGGQEVVGSGDPLPDFMTALEDQLGLKLQARKVPIRVLVVGHAEKGSNEKLNWGWLAKVVS